jgi:hypothetical protein
VGRALVDRLEDFRIDLAEHAAVGDGDGQHPAVGPRPTARTNSSAQTISGTLRRKISSPRTGQRRAPSRLPCRQDAAATARGWPAGWPARQQQRQGHAGGGDGQGLQGGLPQRARNSRSWAGGQKPATKLAIC